MPTRVLWWPPVGLTAWEFTTVKPISRSTGLIGGEARSSSWQPMRREINATVTGRGERQDGAGLVEMLKLELEPGELIRIQAYSSLWHLVRTQYQDTRILGRSGSTEMRFTSGSAELIIGSGGYRGEAQTVDGWPAVRVSGLPPDTIVIRAGETVGRVGDGGAKDLHRRAYRTVRSDGSGVASIRFKGAPWGADALMTLGEPEEVTMEPIDLWTATRAVQPVTGNWGYEFRLKEAFEDAYPGGWTVADPFGGAPG